jgi:precorrin-2 dehydrogenase/sirohydrochlorin ferrochelatase
MFYPIYLNLTGKRVVVIGGGEVAERKIESLLAAGASITLISPDVTSRLHSLSQQSRIDLRQRPYASGDCEGADLVFSATDDGALSAALFRDAHTAGALVNTADQPALCDFIMPAVLRQGDITVAVSTGGKSPGLAARLRDKISQVIGPEYARLAELLARIRPEIQRRIPDVEKRKALHHRILNSDIIERLKRNDSAGAERRLKEIIES